MFDGITNDIKEEKVKNGHRNILFPKRFLLNKDILQHHRRKGRVLLKKVDQNKSNKCDWLKSLNKSTENNEINIEDKLIKKQKIIYYQCHLKEIKGINYQILNRYLRKNNNEKSQEKIDNIDALYNS